MATKLNVTSGFTSTTGTSLTVSNTPNAGADYACIVAVFQSGSGSTTAATFSCTYGGVAATQLVESAANVDRDTPTVVIFGFKNPPSGASDVTVTCSASVAAISLATYNCQDVGGTSAADAVDVSGSNSSGFSTSVSFDLTATGTDGLIIGGVAVQGGDQTMTPGSGYTDDVNTETGLGNPEHDFLAQSRTAPTATTFTFDASWTSGDGNRSAAVILKNAAGGGSQNVSVGQAVETDTAQAVTPSAGSTTISVGQASETDTAQAVTVSATSTISIGQAIETDTSQTVTPVVGAQSVNVGQASETDTAQAVTPSAGSTTISVGQAIETDTSQTVTPSAGGQTVLVGQASETDSAQTATVFIGPATIATGQAVETDSAQTVTPTTGAQTIAVGQAVETDTALNCTAASGSVTVQVGQAVETDTAQTVVNGAATTVELLDAWTRISVSATSAASGETFTVSSGSSRLLVVAIGEESTTGRPFSVTYGNQAMTALPQAVGGGGFPASAQFFILNDSGISAATDSLVRVTFTGTHDGQFRMFASSYVNVSQTNPSIDTHASGTNGVDPTDAVLSTTGNGAVVALISNSNAGTDVTWSGTNEAIEEVASSSYHSVAWSKTTGTVATIDPTLTSENSIGFVAFSMGGLPQTVQVGQAGEADTAQTVIAANVVPIGQAAEIDSAQDITSNPDQTIAVGQAVETDAAGQVSIVNDQTVAVGQAVETDTAEAIVGKEIQSVAVGQAVETDTGQPVSIINDQVVLVGQASETDTAGQVTEANLEAARRKAAREQAGSSSSRAKLRFLQSDYARRMAAHRRVIERDDEELAEIILPAAAQILLRYIR